MYFFGKRHIKNLYVLQNGKEVAIETYRNFGLTPGKFKTYSISQFKGNRPFFTARLNVFQLEYSKAGGRWDRRRSLFYRPEQISDREMWEVVRVGQEIDVVKPKSQGDQDLERIRQL